MKTLLPILLVIFIAGCEKKVIEVILQDDGVSCEKGSECISTHCVEGVCCDGPCDGACKSCKVSGKVGQCSNVPSGQDPKKNCTGTNASCSGACNGNGSCNYPGSAKSCGKDTCNQGKLTTYQCDSKGGCKSTTTNGGWVISVPGSVDAVFPLSSGAAVVCGNFSEPITFKTTKGETQLTGSNLYVAKIDSSGNFIWATAPEGKATVSDLYVDASGNIYIVGPFEGNKVTFGNETLDYETKRPYSSEGYIAKADSTGKFIWAKKFGGPDCFAHAYTVNVDREGNVYVTVQFKGEIAVDGMMKKSNSDSYDVLLIKYSSNGNQQWIRTMNGSGGESVFDIVLDSSGNIYITGSFDSTIDFEGQVENTVGNDDVFVTKISPKGDVAWLTRAGSADYDVGNSIAIDNQGNLYISGRHSSDGTFGDISLKGNDHFIAKLSGTKGEFKWAKNAGVEVKKVALGIDGYLYTSGSFNGKMIFGSSTYTAKGSKDEAYIAQVSPDKGDYLKAEASWGGATAHDLSGFSSGYLFSAGEFDSTTDFGDFSLSMGPGYVWNLKCSAVYP